MGCSVCKRELPLGIYGARWPQALRTALQHTKLIDAAWLVALAEKGGVLPRCQDIPKKAEVAYSDMLRWSSAHLPILVISYPWLGQAHPDGQGTQLRRIAFVLKLFAREAKRCGCRVGVFWDYASLPQRSPKCKPREDDRTADEIQTFNRALHGINAWYADVGTHVLLVNTALPDGEYENKQPYQGRGWCVAEARMSSMVKTSFAQIELSHVSGHEQDLHALLQGQQKVESRPAPMAPDEFHEMLEAGVTDGSIKFTKAGDVALVAKIYKSAFLNAMSSATMLQFSSSNWGDSGMKMFANALSNAHANEALGQCKELELSGNQIGDAGMQAFSTAIASGALGQCEKLTLYNNQIGDAGMQAFSTAIASGALGNCRSLILDRNKIGDAGWHAFSTALASGALGHCGEIWLNRNQISPEAFNAAIPPGRWVPKAHGAFERPGFQNYELLM